MTDTNKYNEKNNRASVLREVKVKRKGKIGKKYTDSNDTDGKVSYITATLAG